jgi:hypothetical protein
MSDADKVIRVEVVPDLVKLLHVVREVHAARADDLCWMDIDRIFAAAGLPAPDRRAGDKFAMLKNCARFIDTMCAGGKWRTYAQLEEDVARLTETVSRLRAEVSDLLVEKHARDTTEAVFARLAAEIDPAYSAGEEPGPVSEQLLRMIRALKAEAGRRGM